MLIGPGRLQQHWPLTAACVLLLLAMATIFSLLVGAVSLSPEQIVAWLGGAADPQTTLILSQLRLPRALMAAFVGASLAASGAVTQGLFRNPLADPSLIGVSAGAAAGASLVIVLVQQSSWGLSGISLVSLGAFAGSLLVTALVYRIATGPLGTSVSTMLLAGIALTFLAGSLTSLLEYLADNEMLRRISLWRMGGLEMAGLPMVVLMAVVFALSFSLFQSQATALNAMLLGESEARHLGINVNRVKSLTVVGVAASVGVAVALTGTIAFLGLLVPHMVRMVTGPNHKSLLPLSACLGALVLILADSFARVVIAPAELPVGLVTVFLGAPVFVSMLIRRRRMRS